MKIILIGLYLSTAWGQGLCRNQKGANCMLESSNMSSTKIPLNIFGEKLNPCCTEPMTGFYRDGFCKSDYRDTGNHSVCARVTDAFLEFTKKQGNDLQTPNPRYGFPGLKPGDKWCLCASRWLEAKNKGIELEVELESTSMRALEVTSDFNFQWKYRVVRCPVKLYEKQFQELASNKELSRELKLIAVPDKNLKEECHLVGLDGEVKEKKNNYFELVSLKEMINKMPMRKRELEKE
jgi:uncharacterized protein (DUF2237 family)